MNVELAFLYTQDEYVKAERQYLFASKTITKANVIVLPVFLLLAILYIFISSFSMFSIVAFAIGLLALLAGCLLYFYIPAHKFKQTAKYQEEYNLTFASDGIKFKTPTVNSELSWKIYSELWESADFYFLIQAPRMYTLIPKRSFANSAAKQDFEAMALACMNCSKRVL